MTGGFIAGGLGAAFAALAELLVLTAAERPSSLGRGSLRIIAAAFIGGQLVLGLVIVALAASLGGTIDLAIGFASPALIGLGSFGIALTYRRYAGRPGEETPRDRSGTILQMALSEAVGIAGVVLAMLALFLSPV